MVQINAPATWNPQIVGLVSLRPIVWDASTDKILGLVPQIVLYGLGGLAFVSLVCLCWCLAVGERPELRSNWGGFGNAGTGWQASSALTFLTLAIAFGILFTGAGVYIMRSMSGVVREQSVHPPAAPSGNTNAAPTGSPAPTGKP